MNEEQQQQNQPVETQEEQKPAVTIDDIQRLAAENEDVKGWLQAEKDRHFSKSIETWKENNLPQLVDQEVKKLYPEETDEQKQLRELKAQFEQLQQDKQKESIRNQAYKQATEKGLPLELLDFFVAEDAEKTTQNLEHLEKVFNQAVQHGVEQKFKSNGREPHQSSAPPVNDLQVQYQKAMAEGNMALAISLKSQMYDNKE